MAEYVRSGPVSGLTIAEPKELARDNTAEKLPEKPKMRTIMKKQPFTVWICNWPVTQRRKCGMKIDGPTPQTVDRNSNLHWDKHIREYQKLPRPEPKRRFSTKGAFSRMKRAAGNKN